MCFTGSIATVLYSLLFTNSWLYLDDRLLLKFSSPPMFDTLFGKWYLNNHLEHFFQIRAFFSVSWGWPNQSILCVPSVHSNLAKRPWQWLQWHRWEQIRRIKGYKPYRSHKPPELGCYETWNKHEKLPVLTFLRHGFGVTSTWQAAACTTDLINSGGSGRQWVLKICLKVFERLLMHHHYKCAHVVEPLSHSSVVQARGVLRIQCTSFGLRWLTGWALWL